MPLLPPETTTRQKRPLPPETITHLLVTTEIRGGYATIPNNEKTSVYFSSALVRSLVSRTKAAGADRSGWVRTRRLESDGDAGASAVPTGGGAGHHHGDRQRL